MKIAALVPGMGLLATAALAAGDAGYVAQPIPGAGRWVIEITLPGNPGRACTARLSGKQIDTVLLLNNDGKLVLIGGHPDWSIGIRDAEYALSIDGENPIKMKATLLDNLFMSPVFDEAMTTRLSKAKTLDWNFPTGHIRNDVIGLGITLKAMRKCKAGA